MAVCVVGIAVAVSTACISRDDIDTALGPDYLLSQGGLDLSSRGKYGTSQQDGLECVASTPRAELSGLLGAAMAEA